MGSDAEQDPTRRHRPRPVVDPRGPPGVRSRTAPPRTPIRAAPATQPVSSHQYVASLSTRYTKSDSEPQPEPEGERHTGPRDEAATDHQADDEHDQGGVQHRVGRPHQAVEHGGAAVGQQALQRGHPDDGERDDQHDEQVDEGVDVPPTPVVVRNDQAEHTGRQRARSCRSRTMSAAETAAPDSSVQLKRA